MVVAVSLCDLHLPVFFAQCFLQPIFRLGAGLAKDPKSAGAVGEEAAWHHGNNVSQVQGGR